MRPFVGTNVRVATKYIPSYPPIKYLCLSTTRHGIQLFAFRSSLSEGPTYTCASRRISCHTCNKTPSRTGTSSASTLPSAQQSTRTTDTASSSSPSPARRTAPSTPARSRAPHAPPACTPHTSSSRTPRTSSQRSPTCTQGPRSRRGTQSTPLSRSTRGRGPGPRTPSASR